MHRIKNRACFLKNEIFFLAGIIGILLQVLAIEAVVGIIALAITAAALIGINALHQGHWLGLLGFIPFIGSMIVLLRQHRSKQSKKPMHNRHSYP